MIEYSTSEVAGIIGVHANTVRLYESIGFITPPKRKSNGYRVYTEKQIYQMKLARTAMRAEVLQNGLRSQAVKIVRLFASMNVEASLRASEEYCTMIDDEISRANNAVTAVEEILAQQACENDVFLTRMQAAKTLGVTSETLRNWERNGLIKLRRKSNGYRVYSQEDMRKLTIIRTLRCANYSLSSILRLMNSLCNGDNTTIEGVLNTPSPDEDIVSVCDRLLVSLNATKSDACEVIELIRNFENKPST